MKRVALALLLFACAGLARAAATPEDRLSAVFAILSTSRMAATFSWRDK